VLTIQVLNFVAVMVKFWVLAMRHMHDFCHMIFHGDGVNASRV